MHEEVHTHTEPCDHKTQLSDSPLGISRVTAADFAVRGVPSSLWEEFPEPTLNPKKHVVLRRGSASPGLLIVMPNLPKVGRVLERKFFGMTMPGGSFAHVFWMALREGAPPVCICLVLDLYY